MLDQTRLPGEVVTVSLRSWPEVVDAIRTMVVRGAPAIGVAGAMGVALAARTAAPAAAWTPRATRSPGPPPPSATPGRRP